MTLAKRLASVEAEAELAEAEKAKPKLPDSWKPGIEWDPTKGGTITTGPLDTPPDDGFWRRFLADWDLDPDKIEVVPGSVKLKGWDATRDGETKHMLSYQAVIRPFSGIAQKDWENLYQEAIKAKTSTKTLLQGWPGGRTLLVCLSDFQTGNPDDEGIEGQLRSLAALVSSVPARLKALRKMGHQIDSVCVAGLGDLIEGTCGFYSSQKFRVEIDRREQVKIVRRAIRDILMAIAPLVNEVKVLCVPGNHGENRDAGRAYTRPGDNDDVAIFEQVADILSHGSAFEHFKWRIPDDEIAVAVDLSGVQTAFTHGHVPRMKGNATETMWAWWEKQAMGRHYAGVADSELLITGHYHHFCAKEQRGRTVFVCPSLTNVSEYYSNENGVNTKHGTLTMLVGGESKWSELCIL